MKYSPIVWLALGAFAVWFLFGRKVAATVSIGPDVTIGRWRPDLGDALGDLPS